MLLWAGYSFAVPCEWVGSHQALEDLKMVRAVSCCFFFFLFLSFITIKPYAE